jgi:hypothetical protein
MTEVTTAPEATAKKAPPKRVFPQLFLTAKGMEPLKVGKYPMPVKAARFPLGVNGQEVEAATTEFKDKKYTYFMYQGVGFWVTGHLNAEVEYTLDFPDGYEFKPVKVDRKAQADAAAAKAKAKKAAAADTASASEESAASASEAAGEGEGSPATSEAPTAPENAPAPKGKKAKR